jgi:MOSC domain-containing protein YiiM
VVSVNVSEKTGVRKASVPSALLLEGSGLAGDAHAGLIDERQVSLLPVEEIEGANVSMREGKGCVKAFPGMELRPGDFAENITTRGLALHELPLGTRIELGGCLLEVTKIGKECHAACEIRRLVGDCVMPRKGIFVRVLRGGEVRRGDRGRYRL